MPAVSKAPKQSRIQEHSWRIVAKLKCSKQDLGGTVTDLKLGAGKSFCTLESLLKSTLPLVICICNVKLCVRLTVHLLFMP